MVDVLPTVLELLGLALPEVVQGRSLAPVLRGKPWTPPPVVLDETYVADDGSVSGWFEVIEEAWGASWRFENAAFGGSIDASELRLCAPR